MNDAVIWYLAVNTAGSLVLALVALGCEWGRARPQILHLLWLAALVNLITPPVVRVPVPVPMRVWLAPATPTATPAEIKWTAVALSDVPRSAPSEGSEASDPSRPAAAPSVATSPPRWPLWVYGFWIAGSAGWAGLAMGRMLRFHRLLRHAELLDSRCPRVFAVDAPISPLLWAFLGRARIVMPQALFDSLTVAERATLLRHERAHFRRRDHWVRWVEFGVLTAMWWHPLAWWASRRLRAAEEACCDAEVVTDMADRRPYATALVRTALFLSETAVVPRGATGIGTAASIHHRVHSIMNSPASRPLSWPASLVLLSVTAIAVLATPMERETTAAGDSPTTTLPPDPPPIGAVAAEPPADESAGGREEPSASEPPSPPFEPERQYLNGYIKMQEAEKEWRTGNTIEATALFQEALTLFESVKAQAPEWHPSMVAYRLELVRRMLEPGPLGSLTGQFTISRVQTAPEPSRRIALQSRLLNQPLAFVVDRMEMVTPEAYDRSNPIRFNPGSNQSSPRSSGSGLVPTLTATGTVRGGWGPWRMIADRLEIDSTGFTLSGNRVLLVDVSADPPRTVLVGRHMSFDPMQRKLTVIGEAVAMCDTAMSTGDRIDLILSQDGAWTGSLRWKKSRMELNLSNQRLESERALFLQSWPGQDVLETELGPLLDNKNQSDPPAPNSPPVDAPHQEPPPNENTAPQILPE